VRYAFKDQKGTTSLKTIIPLGSTGAKSPEEVSETLDRFGIEWHVTEGGTLMIKYWQTVAEDFVTPEHSATIRSSRQSPEQENELDWLGKNLENIRGEYGGQWVAIYNNEIMASTQNLSDLLNQIVELDRPFITYIPSEPVVWTFTYAR
jgi:hypothetical protein